MHHVLMFVSTIDSLLLYKTNFIDCYNNQITIIWSYYNLYQHVTFILLNQHLTEIIQKCRYVFYKFRIWDRWKFHISNVEKHSRYETPRQYNTNSQYCLLLNNYILLKIFAWIRHLKPYQTIIIFNGFFINKLSTIKIQL